MGDLHWHRESALRDYLYEHPEVLFPARVDRKHRELRVEGKFIDLMFEVGGVHHIVELKRDKVSREAVGQVLEYYGRLRRLHPSQEYRVLLVAPNIPDYRRLPLEEFGIRCVEVRPELHQDEKLPDIAVIQAAVKRAAPLAVGASAGERLSFPLLLPPCQPEALQLSHRLLVASLPAVEQEFSPFEIMPVSMRHASPPDVLCLRDGNGRVEYMRPGVWWAYAFGAAEHMAKNDKPNISVNAYPWGLDVAVNAELKTSQRVVLDRVSRARAHFNELRVEHGQLDLQLWMKLEHQPRFYHWIPLEQKAAGEWGAATLLERVAALRQEYPLLREKWFAEVFANQRSLTQPQRAHMERSNRELNVAIRFVQTFQPGDPIWGEDFGNQLTAINAAYRSLKPLIEFFH